MSIFISQFFVELLTPFGDTPPQPETPTARTMRFDAGLGERVAWWVIPQISDAGDNLRDKCVKSFISIGKMTEPQFSIYAYGPHKSIDVSRLEEGAHSSSGKKRLPSTTQVQRYARQQINVPNGMLTTCRLEGIWDGEGDPDTVHEIVYEIASQGIRR